MDLEVILLFRKGQNFFLSSYLRFFLFLQSIFLWNLMILTENFLLYIFLLLSHSLFLSMFCWSHFLLVLSITLCCCVKKTLHSAQCENQTQSHNLFSTFSGHSRHLTLFHIHSVLATVVRVLNFIFWPNCNIKRHSANFGDNTTTQRAFPLHSQLGSISNGNSSSALYRENPFPLACAKRV